MGVTKHTITASNNGGSAYATLSINTALAPPESIDYGAESFTFPVGQPVFLAPRYSGDQITTWSVYPNLSKGLSISQSGAISGIPIVLQPLSDYTISAHNSGGSINEAIQIEVVDISIWGLEYSQITFEISLGDEINTNLPSWGGGDPISWEVRPPLPNGLSLNNTSGEIYGTAIDLQDWSTHII